MLWLSGGKPQFPHLHTGNDPAGLRVYVFPKTHGAHLTGDSSKSCSHPYPTSSSLINPLQQGSPEIGPPWFSGCYCHQLSLQIPTLGLDGNPLSSFVLCCIKEPSDLCGSLSHMPQFPYLYSGRKQGPLLRSNSEKPRRGYLLPVEVIGSRTVFALTMS